MKNKVEHRVVIVTGPTSTGKTKLAVYLAKKLTGEIISADSRQVYSGLNIGTNKFSKNCKWLFNEKSKLWFADGIPVYLYDVVAPGEQFSAFDFYQKSILLIKEINHKNKLPIIVGGSGFYLKTLIDPPGTINVPPNYSLRSELEKLPINDLKNHLKKINSARWETIDLHNRRRLIRAIEVAVYLREKLPILVKDDFKFNKIIIGLKAPREVLYKNVLDWVKNISYNQLPIETGELIKKGYKNSPVVMGIIYKPTIDYLDGLIDFNTYQQKLYLEVRNYIKRQLTWFNKQPDIIWFDATDRNMPSKVEKVINKWLNSHK